MIEKTFVMLKPDAVQRSIMGKIITRFEDAGLKVIGMKMVWVDQDFSKKHYEVHVGKSFYAGLEKYVTEGPVVAMVIEGISAIETVRKIVGPTEPKSASPGTIRGDFAHHSFNYTDSHGKSIRNLIHASGTGKEAEKEIKLWFKDEELHTYTTAHDLHVL